MTCGWRELQIFEIGGDSVISYGGSHVHPIYDEKFYLWLQTDDEQYIGSHSVELRVSFNNDLTATLQIPFTIEIECPE